MNKILSYLLLLCMVAIVVPASAQSVTLSKDQMIALTSEWEGERFDDGRPKVPDNIIERMKFVSIEEAWGVLRGQGYHSQFDGGWEMIYDDVPVVGRALTARYMPDRKELAKRMLEYGHENEGRVGAMNSWPIDALVKGDVYVADGFGKIVDGTLIGDNLGNAIFAKSGNGVVFDGGSRDLGGLQKIDGFNAFVRGWDPSYLQNVMLMGLNTPIRIGRATVLPGDVVLAKREGVIFIPAHLAERVVTTSEVVSLRDGFGHQRLREGTYTPGQIDTRWTDEIEADFMKWVEDHPEKLHIPLEEMKELLKSRTW